MPDRTLLTERALAAHVAEMAAAIAAQRNRSAGATHASAALDEMARQHRARVDKVRRQIGVRHAIG